MTLIATTQDQIEKSRARLDRYIKEGSARAVSALERIEREVPTDHVAPAALMRVVEGDGPNSPLWLNVQTRDERTAVSNPLHRHALGNLASQASMPMAYVDHLLGQGDWGRVLVARNLTDGVRFGNAQSKYLVRTAGGNVRAVLSNKFRRIDARPILEMLVTEASRIGAKCVDGTVSDIRVEMKFIVPRILEPAPGEFMVFGFAWSNSDYGAGANSLRSFAFRLACFNGATLEQNLRQIHLGRALSEDVEWSRQTQEADTRTATFAARDTARALLSDERIARTADVISRAHAEGIDPKVTLAGLKKKGITKATEAKIAEAFNSPDVVELPPGNTMWRFSNAISLVARNTQDAEQKLELERLAGDVLPKAA